MLLNVSRYNLLYNFCAILYLCTYINIYVLCTPSVIWYNMRGVKSLNLAIGPKSIQSWDKPCQLVSWRRHGPKHPLLQTWVAGWFRSPRIGVNGSWFLLISWLLWRSYSPISNVPRWLNGGKHWEKHSRWQIQVNKWWIFFFFGRHMTETKVWLGAWDKCILLFWNRHIWGQSIQETLCIPNVLHVFTMSLLWTMTRMTRRELGFPTKFNRFFGWWFQRWDWIWQRCYSTTFR